MSRISMIQAQIAELNRQLGILNSAPADTFPLGTVVVFNAATGSKWYYFKVAEETWASKDGEEKDLASWILEAMDSNIGYFEVYKLLVSPTPIFASA